MPKKIPGTKKAMGMKSSYNKKKGTKKKPAKKMGY